LEVQWAALFVAGQGTHHLGHAAKDFGAALLPVGLGFDGGNRAGAVMEDEEVGAREA
jgi:hypothetical protein